MVGTARILVVDDDQNLLRVTSRILATDGHEVLTASTGQEALRLAQESLPDLILLDVVLPDIHGTEVCQKIKADESLANLHIILLSSFHTDSNSQVEGLETGADGYIARPISNRELRARVQAILRLIETKKALARKSQELERSNTDLENFAYMVSHDLQEPLRMVIGFLNLLDKGYKDSLDKEALEYINFAVDGAQRMKKLISDLLAFSRVGTQPMEFSLTDCNQVLEMTLNNLGIVIEESGAAITSDQLPEIVVDPDRLGQLFQNLIANALKFRGDKIPKIHISATKNEREWEFSVKDNGIGIDPKQYERIFLIFQRLHTQGEYPGTGIGLAICKRIVENHGGRIWIESQPGYGTTFFFTLPMEISQ